MNRLNFLRNQLKACCLRKENKKGNCDEVVIAAAVRTPLTKAKRGGLKDCYPEELLGVLYREIVRRTKIKHEDVDDFIIGNALQTGAGFLSSRISQALGGFNDSNPIYVINRLCASGLQAIINGYNLIKAGDAKVIIAGGVESMSLHDFTSMLSPSLLSPSIIEEPFIKKYLLPMGLTNENICEKYFISRKEQDEFACESHSKALQAQKNKVFVNEIVPVPTKSSVIENDDGIREGTTVESLAKLKPVFKENGTTTAGNASQLTDGAALCLLMTHEKAKELSCPILGTIIAYSCIGVPSEYMGIGPAKAIPALLTKISMTIDDIDLFEINEAFAGQAIHCISSLKIPQEKVNINGGAIALGHPLGCTGSRLVVSILHSLIHLNKQYGIVSMCIGTGMGAACLIKNLQYNSS